jgi:hypothetical protein
LSTIKDLNFSDKIEISNFTSKVQLHQIEEISEQSPKLVSPPTKKLELSLMSNAQENQTSSRMIGSNTLELDGTKGRLSNIGQKIYSSDVLTNVDEDYEMKLMQLKRKQGSSKDIVKPKFEGFNSQLKQGKIVESEIREGNLSTVPFKIIEILFLYFIMFI